MSVKHQLYSLSFLEVDQSVNKWKNNNTQTDGWMGCKMTQLSSMKWQVLIERREMYDKYHKLGKDKFLLRDGKCTINIISWEMTGTDWETSFRMIERHMEKRGINVTYVKSDRQIMSQGYFMNDTDLRLCFIRYYCNSKVILSDQGLG